MLKKWIIILTLLSASGCRENPVKLVDDYRIYKQDEFGNGHYLICKLSCRNDPEIENIIYVKWNRKYIILETKYQSWFIIKAKGAKLKCCNGDKLIGPLTRKELDEFLNNINFRDFKEKSFD